MIVFFDHRTGKILGTQNQARRDSGLRIRPESVSSFAVGHQIVAGAVFSEFERGSLIPAQYRVKLRKGKIVDVLEDPSYRAPESFA